MRKAKVMIIDDNADFTDELKETLAACDYEVEVCNDSKSAVKKISKTMPDVVLMDMKMPGKSGLEVAYELKRNRDTARITIIAMSAFYIEKETLRVCGIESSITKPFNPVDIINRIEQAI